MKHYIDPANQYEANQNALERQAESSQYFLWVWETFEVIVSGLRLLVEVDGHVIREGEHGNLSISDDLRFKSIAMFVDKHEEPFKIDEDDLANNHSITWNDLQNSVDLEILQYAKNSDKWEIE